MRGLERVVGVSDVVVGELLRVVVLEVGKDIVSVCLVATGARCWSVVFCLHCGARSTGLWLYCCSFPEVASFVWFSCKSFAVSSRHFTC